MRILPLLLTALLSACASVQQTPSEPSTLPQGHWHGTLKNLTWPDYELTGEREFEFNLMNCGNGARTYGLREDGSIGVGTPLTVLPYHRTFVLYFFATQDTTDGWIESQFWTLVENTPEEWTVTQSRSVLNPRLELDETWRTFRHLSWGSVRFSPCRYPDRGSTQTSGG